MDKDKNFETNKDNDENVVKKKCCLKIILCRLLLVVKICIDLLFSFVLDLICNLIDVLKCGNDSCNTQEIDKIYREYRKGIKDDISLQFIGDKQAELIELYKSDKKFSVKWLNYRLALLEYQKNGALGSVSYLIWTIWVTGILSVLVTATFNQASTLKELCVELGMMGHIFILLLIADVVAMILALSFCKWLYVTNEDNFLMPLERALIMEKLADIRNELRNKDSMQNDYDENKIYLDPSEYIAAQRGDEISEEFLVTVRACKEAETGNDRK